MSEITSGSRAIHWIEKNQPENGLFRVYWKDVQSTHRGGATLDPDKGEGLRYEWYYKDGKRADGESKGWWPNGQIKHIWTWKDGELNGLYTYWHENGQKVCEEIYKDGKSISYKSYAETKIIMKIGTGISN